MRYVYTDGKNKDFIALCHELDALLNKLAGGEENRAQYIVYNSLDDIHNAVLIFDRNLPVGCAAFKKYDDRCAEVKRVFIRPEYRGKGLSKKLMKMLEERAKQQGFSYLILESGEPLISAMALYRAIGYSEIPRYGQYADMKESVCMNKKL